MIPNCRYPRSHLNASLLHLPLSAGSLMTSEFVSVRVLRACWGGTRKWPHCLFFLSCSVSVSDCPQVNTDVVFPWDFLTEVLLTCNVTSVSGARGNGSRFVDVARWSAQSASLISVTTCSYNCFSCNENSRIYSVSNFQV